MLTVYLEEKNFFFRAFVVFVSVIFIFLICFVFITWNCLDLSLWQQFLCLSCLKFTPYRVDSQNETESEWQTEWTKMLQRMSSHITTHYIKILFQNINTFTLLYIHISYTRFSKTHGCKIKQQRLCIWINISTKNEAISKKKRRQQQ